MTLGAGERFFGLGLGVQQVRQNARETDRRMHSNIKLGVIESVDYENAKAKVQLANNHVTGPLNWLEHNAYGDKSWNPPKVGEQVVILSESGNLANAVILKGIYQNNHRVTEFEDGNVEQIEFTDSTKIKYNKSNKKLSADVNDAGSIAFTVGNSNINITDGSIVLSSNGVTLTIDSGGVHADGAILENTGNVADFQGTMLEMRTVYNSHNHPGDSGGTTGATSAPMT